MTDVPVGSTRSDVVLVVAIAAVLFVVFLFPFALTDYPVPVGPDVPVYLWWSRVGASEGLSVVGERPGTPALIPTLRGVLGPGWLTTVAGLQYALGPAIGLAGAALLRGRDRAPAIAWTLGGVLTGIWAVFLGAGYLANLAFVACFLAAAGALARRTPRGTMTAVLLLSGGGLAHPQFFAVGVGILALAAVWSVWLDRESGAIGWRTDAGRTVAALAGSAGAVGVGLLSMQVGPALLEGDTSKDAFLRRVGRWDALGRIYLDRFRRDPGRYAPWASIPLAALGAWRGFGGSGEIGAVFREGRRGGFVRRFLLAWLVLTIVAVPIGAATRWYPPDRILTFAFCVPLLAALGLVWLCQRVGGRQASIALGLALVGLLVAAPITSWANQRGFLGPEELEDTVAAGRIAATLPAGTTLVYVVDEPGSSGLFAASHALNVARGTVPPERAHDVRVYLGEATRLLDGELTRRPNALFTLASEISLDDIPSNGPVEVFVIADFARGERAFDDPRLVRWSDGLATTVPDPRPLPAVPDEPGTSSPRAMGLSAIGTFALLLAAGYGWARWTFGRVGVALAAAPACGVAILTVVAVTAERIGVPLDGRIGPVAISVLAGGGGYLVLALRGRARTDEVAPLDERHAEIGAPAEVP